MSTTIRSRCVVIADDLSGAAEAAATLGPGTLIALSPDADGARTEPRVVLDTAARSVAPGEARTRTLAARRVTRTPDTTVVLKVDSLVRGPLTCELAPFLEDDGVIAFSPALPAQGRTTVGGIIHINDVPLDRTDLWSHEATAAPADITAALAPLPTTGASLDIVRGGGLATALDAHRGEVVICDARTEDDLTAIAQAVHACPGAIAAGASALVGALVRSLGIIHAQDNRGAHTALDSSHRHGLIVVGSASPQAAHQAGLLASRRDITVLRPPVLDLVAEDPASTISLWGLRVRRALEAGDVILARVPEPPSARVDGRLLSRRTAQIVEAASIDPTRVALGVLGGETARDILDILGVTRLRVIGEAHPGAVLATDDRGLFICTRPGSFGGPHSLITIHQAMTGGAQPCPTGPDQEEFMSQSVRPVVAVTMGDGAGVGPEVCVAAVLDPGVQAACVPVVIGDAVRLRQAARILEREDVDIVPIEAVEDAVVTPTRVNVIDLGLLPEDLPWGQLSPVAGDAAYQYIKVAADLAMAGKVQAICTAPLNKEALHMGGHNYPGHTEMLADLTHTPEVSMMLMTPKLRVIHVTTHIGLIDAVAKIEPDLVQRTVERGNNALRAAGIAHPHIGVCAINPHAGEGGLFGHGEEETKIVPAITALQAEGIDAVGPLPADTAFYLGGRGDYDLIVAMYHDQGHGPIKVLGIEAGVNITVGLPVIRTSVDHGTAFDIAGTGAVSPDSMIEAMHQAVTLATRPTDEGAGIPAEDRR